MNAVVNSLHSKLESARMELLDLGLRNPLLNYRPLRSRGLEVVNELSIETYRILAVEKKSMTFLPASDDDETSPLLSDPEDQVTTNGQLATNYSDLRLQTVLSSSQLQNRLLATYYAARTNIEEQGVNILFLALGMLQWYESDESQDVLRAPLILIPVELVRSNAREKFHLHYTEEEIGENLSLMAKMKEDFAITLPEIPEIEDLDIAPYFSAISNSIQSQPRWSIDNDAIVLGFFSFNKFLMFRDLDGTNWPENLKPTNHPIIQALLQEGFHESPHAIVDAEKIDEQLTTFCGHQVVDADSSQSAALVEGIQGRNLIIQGPPGTGKSQTITNLIAEAIGQGKTVLFVAEKMAALEVVKRRLDKVGLGVACLELHSHKSHKKTLLKELSTTLELGRPRTIQAEAELSLLDGIRQRLNDYCEAVNSPVAPSGVAPYKAYGEFARVHKKMEGIEKPDIDPQQCQSWNEVEFECKKSILEELQAQLETTGVPEKHPFWGSQLRAFLPMDKERLLKAMSKAKESTRILAESVSKLADSLLLTKPIDLHQAKQAHDIGSFVNEAPSLLGVHFGSGEWLQYPDDLKDLLNAGARFAELHRTYDSILKAEGWGQNTSGIRTAMGNQGKHWWRFVSGKYRRAHKALKALLRGIPPTAVHDKIRILDAINDEIAQKETIRKHGDLAASLFGSQWSNEVSDWKQLSAVFDWVTSLHQGISAGKLPKEILELPLDEHPVKDLSVLLQKVEADMKAFSVTLHDVLTLLEFDEKKRFGSKLEDKEFTSVDSVLANWQESIDQLHSVVTFNNLTDTCKKEDLSEFAQASASWPPSGKHLVDLFLEIRYGQLISRAFKERPALSRFDGTTHTQLVDKFRNLDKLWCECNQARLALAHWSKLPKHDGGGQLGVLKREFEKRARHLPIRQLILKAGNAIQAIKPVFMLSPLSIAAFLAPGSVNFDMVIFDEASQVKPVDAFGAILRGKQTVVVGDSRQLPPTNFFDSISRGDEPEEDDVISDIESILGLFSAQGALSRMLKWHYRSRHESLIAVSNHHFYDNRLVVFPSPNNTEEELGLYFHHLPQTTYDRGKTRTNKEEAKVVAQAVMEHARGHKDLTLGVAAFSVAQMEAILQSLELLRRQDPSCETFFNAHPHEPFFIKNLENVQGDERDVIFISVGYGRTAEGYVSMDFGPVNRNGGERRLNVLITRARIRCEVFTNLTSDDIDLNRSSAQGVIALKSFLKFAQYKQLDVPMATGREAESPFEEMVCDSLAGLGYKVQRQVGSGGFFIDLAVVDDDQPGRYIAGIECDGATYHRARSARDRDRLRQQVLEGLGWRIHRIWSTDWFKNPEKELTRAIAAIEEARNARPSRKQRATATPDEAGRAVERESGGNLENAFPDIPPYTTANLTILTGGQELHKIDPSTIASWVVSVVKAEGPIHIEELMHRIGDAAGVKIGSRIKAAITSAIDQCVWKGAIQRKRDFLWPNDMGRPPLRDRTDMPASSKKLELIAPEEIALAIETAVKKAYGMKREEIPPVACRLLGFQRTTTEDMHVQIETQIEELLRAGKMVKHGDHLTIG